MPWPTGLCWSGCFHPRGASGNADTGYNDRDRTGCVTPDMTKTYISAHSHEILACQARVLSERDWAEMAAGGGSKRRC